MKIALLTVALLQSLAIAWSMGASGEPFVVTPYFRRGPEPNWRAFDAAAARLPAADASRGSAAEERLYALRNDTHHLNMAVCHETLAMLALLSPGEQRRLRAAVPVRSDDALASLSRELTRR